MAELIINGRGEVREVKPPTSFPDKKERNWSTEDADEILRRATAFSKNFEVGQDEATWIPPMEYPMLPMAILFATDIHYGSIHSQVDLLNRHLQIVEETPNFGMISNGDDVDNFNAVIHATGMTENPLPPQIQSRVIVEKLRRLDKKSKIGVMSHGNHNNFGFVAGQEWEESFLAEMNCPVFTKGGRLHVMVQGQEYQIGMNHTYWGKSKLNPTNAPKRMLEYEFPNADVVFMGHTHQHSFEMFERGHKQVLAVVGGTYKDPDPWAAKNGIGMRSGSPGMTAMFFPEEKKMEMFDDIETARVFMMALIGEIESRKCLSRLD